MYNANVKILEVNFTPVFDEKSTNFIDDSIQIL